MSTPPRIWQGKQSSYQQPVRSGLFCGPVFFCAGNVFFRSALTVFSDHYTRYLPVENATGKTALRQDIHAGVQKTVAGSSGIWFQHLLLKDL
jgi:hypothetical protein